MLDIELCTKGNHANDLSLTDDGDIVLSNSIPQNARIAVLWIQSEWRFNPDLGLPWYEEILTKNPNIEIIQSEIRSALLSIENVTDAIVRLTDFDFQKRTVKISFEITTVKGDSFSEEVVIDG